MSKPYAVDDAPSLPPIPTPSTEELVELYRQAVQRWLHWRLGAETPLRIDAVMLFTRSGEGAWLLDNPGEP